MATFKALRCFAICLLTFHVALLMPALAMAQDAPTQGPVPTSPQVVRKVGEGNQYYPDSILSRRRPT
jgi:hypothetical protein